MKVFLAQLEETELLPLLKTRSALSVANAVVDEPAAADLILLLGSFSAKPNLLLDDPCYRAFPDRCAVYTEDDIYLPIVPGVYCSAHIDRHTQIGRIFSYTYISRNGRYKNPYLAEVDSAAPIASATRKKYLFSFQGGSTSLLRKRMFNLRFNRPDVLIENTSAYYHWDDSQPERIDRQAIYAETVAASHFVLCPRGAGVASIRFFEVMSAGIAPVLIADDYALPPGPAWDDFLLRVRERDIEKLPALLEKHLPSAAERGRLARETFLRYFSVQHEFDRVVELAALSLRHAPPAEGYFRRQQAAVIRRVNLQRRVRGLIRSAALRAIQLLHLENPYEMNTR
jgi:hypothetical protein